MLKIETIQELHTAVDLVLQYNWADELEDYRECNDEDPLGNARTGHIFERLVELHNFIHCLERTPQSCVEPTKADGLCDTCGQVLTPDYAAV